MEIFKVNGINIDKDTFMRKIVETLDVIKFANIDQLSIILKAKHSDVHNMLLDVIIWYVKNHPGISYTDLCIDLSVKSEYVDELIDEGRIFDNSDFSKQREELLKIEKTTEPLTSKFVRDVQRKEAIRGLSNSIALSNNDNIQKKKINRFYTNPGDYKFNR
jgi:hypothetical protein